MTLFVQLEQNLEQELRQNAMKQFGYSKGAIKEAVGEAIEIWLASKPIGITPVPITAFRGLLRSVRGTSVELKHRAVELFAK